MRANELARACLLFLMVCGLVAAVFPSPARAAANPTPMLALRLDAPSQSAPVTESAAAVVTFTGQATIDKLPVERAFVTLTASTDTGWPARISPELAVFTSISPQAFACSVIVPAGTPNNLSGNLLIQGRSNAGGMLSIAQTRCVIGVEPYFRANLTSDRPVYTIFQGEQCPITIFAGNQGNAIDSFEVGISNLGELADARWTVVICGGTLPKVRPGEIKPMRLIAQSSRDALTFSDSITVIVFKVTSQCAKDFQKIVSENITLSIYVRANWHRQPGIGLLPPLIVLSVVLAIVTVKLDGRTPRGRW